MSKLFLFPVPMGESEPLDVLPAINIDHLRRVTHFIVENVRSARRFIKACDRDIDVNVCQFAELNRHTDPKDVADMLQPMAEGYDMGVISEAGCPAIADPGADVVAIAQSRGYEVVPLVGPSSIVMSLMASGFNGQNFAFNGYLPIDADARASKFKEMERRIRREHQTQIFIETPYRNNKLIDAMTRSLPADIKLCVASDITGQRQNIVTLPLSAWKARKYDYDKVPTIFLLYK